MARTTHAAVDRRVDPQRPADKPGFHGDSWLNRAAWPVSFLGAVYLGAATFVYFKYGAERAQAWLDFLAGPAAIAALTILVTAGITVVRKVNQMAKGEMWSATAASTAASTKAEVATTREELGDTREEFKAYLVEVVKLLKEKPTGSGREPDPTTGEIKALVLQIAGRMDRIEERATSAASAATGARDAVVAFGGPLEAYASSTDQMKARTEAARGAAQDTVWRTQPSSPGEPFPAPPPGRPKPSADPLDTSRPWYRDPTSQQPAVPAADEQEDWRPGDDQDDGPGLPTGYRMDFRAAMEAADRDAANPFLDERLLRGQAPEPTQQPTAPTPRFPRPDADERARQADARRQLRDQQPRWDNPEEGPR